jgi:hypothetical protein
MGKAACAEQLPWVPLAWLGVATIGPDSIRIAAMVRYGDYSGVAGFGGNGSGTGVFGMCGRPSGQGVRGIGPGGPNTAPFNDPVGVYVQADAAGAGGVQGTGGGSNGALSPGWS